MSWNQIFIGAAFLAVACSPAVPAPDAKNVAQFEMGSSPEQEEGPRLALLIFQSEYQDRKLLPGLPGTPEEARMVSDALKSAGFSVDTAGNQTKDQLKETIRNFRRKLEAAGPQSVGFLYYTGHGVHHEGSGENYMLGADASLAVPSDIVESGVSLEDLRDSFGAIPAQAIFLVFDACRDIPALGPATAGSKGLGATKGLTRLDAKTGMLIAYAADQTKVAYEGVYAPILANELRKGGANRRRRFWRDTGQG